MVENKKKKKTSQAQKIKRLKERLKENDGYYNYARKQWLHYKTIVDTIEKILPKYYYEIKFKALNNHNGLSEFTWVRANFTAELLVKETERNCEKFELISIKQLTTN